MADGRSTDFERCPLSHTNQRCFSLFCINSSWRWCTRDVRVPCGQCSSELFARTFKKHLLASSMWQFVMVPVFASQFEVGCANCKSIIYTVYDQSRNRSLYSRIRRNVENVQRSEAKLPSPWGST